MDDPTKSHKGHHGRTTTDRLNTHSSLEEDPQFLERRMLCVLLPLFAFAATAAVIMSTVQGLNRWYELYLLIPSIPVFLGLFVAALRVKDLRPVRYLSLLIGPGVILVRYAQLLWDLHELGFETEYYFNIGPWLILSSALFVFFIPERWSWMPAFAYYLISAVMAIAFLAVNGARVPPFIENELYLNYLIAHPVFLVLLMTFISLRSRYVRAQTHAEDLRQLALQDGLTGLQNRRAFRVAFKRAKSRQLRHKTPLSVILLDIDHFKRVNDTYGHQVGDEVLMQLANVLVRGLRGTDEVFRWGGEEFMLLLQETDLKGAADVAERLRKDVENEKMLEKATITSSFGVTEILPEEGEEIVYPRADEALYVAKRDGRNRVESVQSPLTDTQHESAPAT